MNTYLRSGVATKLCSNLRRFFGGVGHPADVLKPTIEERAVVDVDRADDGAIHDLTDNVVYGIREGAASEFTVCGNHQGWAFDVAVNETRLTDCACVPGELSKAYEFAGERV